VLRLWRDSVHIAIYRDAAVLARIPRGLRRSIQASHTERPDNTAGGGLAALEAALQDHRWHGADATVLVSNALVRYSLMPSSSELVTNEDERDFALHRIGQTHGEPAGGWSVRLGHPLLQCSQPVAALSAGFVEQLRSLLGAARLRPAAIRPFFMHAYDKARARIRENDFWFANVEPDNLLLARVKAGNWTSLSVRATGQSSLKEALTARLAEASLLDGEEQAAGRLYVHAPGSRETPRDFGPGIEAVHLCPSPGSISPDARLALGQVLGV
jgi:hypothetical protein